MTDLADLSSKLQPWTGELVGTICLTGYTANTWMGKDSRKNLSLNIQWIIVLASP
jgi:hypothetical protein